MNFLHHPRKDTIIPLHCSYNYFQPLLTQEIKYIGGLKRIIDLDDLENRYYYKPYSYRLRSTKTGGYYSWDLENEIKLGFLYLGEVKSKSTRDNLIREYNTTIRISSPSSRYTFKKFELNITDIPYRMQSEELTPLIRVIDELNRFVSDGYDVENLNSEKLKQLKIYEKMNDSKWIKLVSELNFNEYSQKRIRARKPDEDENVIEITKLPCNTYLMQLLTETIKANVNILGSVRLYNDTIKIICRVGHYCSIEKLKNAILMNVNSRLEYDKYVFASFSDSYKKAK